MANSSIALVGQRDAIENGTHNVRDVSMGEDAYRIANPTAALNMVNPHDPPSKHLAAGSNSSTHPGTPPQKRRK